MKVVVSMSLKALIISLTLAFSVQAEDALDIKVKQITKIYRASMKYIFSQQSLINGNHDDKSALFGERFINKLETTYKEQFAEQFPSRDDKDIERLLRLMIEVMEDNRTLITDKELGFKGFIPAIFAFQLSSKAREQDFGIRIKFTNIQERVRNKLNSPDSWETHAFTKIDNGDNSDYLDKNATFNGVKAYRYMLAVKLSSMCLNCHGVAKDNPVNKGKNKANWKSIDKTGFEMEGWNINELGGGISVVVYGKDLY